MPHLIHVWCAKILINHRKLGLDQAARAQRRKNLQEAGASLGVDGASSRRIGDCRRRGSDHPVTPDHQLLGTDRTISPLPLPIGQLDARRPHGKPQPLDRIDEPPPSFGPAGQFAFLSSESPARPACRHQIESAGGRACRWTSDRRGLDRAPDQHVQQHETFVMIPFLADLAGGQQREDRNSAPAPSFAAPDKWRKP